MLRMVRMIGISVNGTIEKIGTIGMFRAIQRVVRIDMVRMIWDDIGMIIKIRIIGMKAGLEWIREI